MQKETLVYARSTDSTVLDPAFSLDEESNKVITNIFEGLVRFKPGTSTIEPCLAEAWRVSPDGREWTFYLRRDVKFHDGTPFNSEAVRYSVERQMPAQRTDRASYASFTFGMVENIITPDPYTVKFILKYPYAPFLNNLAMASSAPIVSPSAASALGEAFSEKPVGTGPYRFVNWEKGKNITLKENRDYWGKLPDCPTLVFTVIKNSRLRSLALKMGLVDIVDGIAIADARFLEQKGFPILKKNGLDLNYLGFFTDKQPFNNPAVRKAVCMLIDRKQIIEGLFQNASIEAISPLPPGVLGYDPNSRPIPYDPAVAKELLARSGYAEGLKIKIITYNNTRPYNPAGGEKLAATLKAELAKAGIEAEVKLYPWEQYKEALLQEEGDAFLYGWISDNGDPDNFLYTLLSSAQIESGLNTARYRNSEVDLLLARAQQETEPTLREQAYRNAAKIVVNDAPWLFLNHSLKIYATTTRIEGFVPHFAGFTPLNSIKKQKLN
ncbi:ABC transporter substrate-binding protein [Pelotomaculum propionicicum]|uniref:ABC transporter substrate-binding protein n=1 Tax=Pelotomaculum propionicicum TaxID=258475 RepID=UPI001FA97345|nr:ABC transporter substrate-binding protein [Pelotomaculum propionicicum]